MTQHRQNNRLSANKLKEQITSPAHKKKRVPKERQAQNEALKNFQTETEYGYSTNWFGTVLWNDSVMKDHAFIETLDYAVGSDITASQFVGILPRSRLHHVFVIIKQWMKATPSQVMDEKYLKILELIEARGTIQTLEADQAFVAEHLGEYCSPYSFSEARVAVGLQNNSVSETRNCRVPQNINMGVTAPTIIVLSPDSEREFSSSPALAMNSTSQSSQDIESSDTLAEAGLLFSFASSPAPGSMASTPSQGLNFGRPLTPGISIFVDSPKNTSGYNGTASLLRESDEKDAQIQAQQQQIQHLLCQEEELRAANTALLAQLNSMQGLCQQAYTRAAELEVDNEHLRSQLDGYTEQLQQAHALEQQMDANLLKTSTDLQRHVTYYEKACVLIKGLTEQLDSLRAKWQQQNMLVANMQSLLGQARHQSHSVVYSAQNLDRENGADCDLPPPLPNVHYAADRNRQSERTSRMGQSQVTQHAHVQVIINSKPG